MRSDGITIEEEKNKQTNKNILKYPLDYLPRFMGKVMHD
jgi:hypothetical protein